MIKRKYFDAVTGSTLVATLLLPATLPAQVLEEIVVTAQRREQSLQDVPVSIQTVTGEEIMRQGLRTLNDLSTLAPGLVITESAEEQGLMVRGAGTQGKNLGFEQGAPTFIDGIHFGRASSIKSAFLDVERIEVLRGPQPVFFGQNASAGALNITSRKPSDEWMGSMDVEVGSFGRRSIESAIGGPITDTLGIRLAARYDHLEGFMRDWLTGSKFPMRESKIGRVTLQWEPTDSFMATAKFEMSDLNLGPRAHALIRDRFPASDFELESGESAYLTGVDGLDVPGIDGRLGVGEITNLGAARSGPFLSPTGYTQANSRNSGGFLDITECTPGMLSAGGSYVGPGRYENCQFEEASGSKPSHGILDLTYTFGNGIEIQSLSGFSNQKYFTVRDSGGPFVSNPRHRAEDFKQLSTELRLSSPLGESIEWMTGLYWQKNDLEVQSNVWRMNARRGIRGNRSAEDAEWMSGFATITFNFLDEKASLDIGARYTQMDKFGKSQNLAAEWIVRDPNTGDPYTLPYGVTLDKYDPEWANAVIIGRTPLFDNADDFQPGAKVSSRRIGSVQNSISESSFDPQIVFRYRPSENVSTYLKYATSFKGGGFDFAVSEVTTHADDFVFKSESVDIVELGLRADLFDNRATAEVTVFNSTFDDLQVSYIDRLLDRNITKNVAKQHSRGVEFSGRMLLTENLTASVSGILMDAALDSFPDAVCTREERDIGTCDPDTGTIDRSGQPARNAPDWQGVFKVQHDRPIFERFLLRTDATVSVSDGYITDRGWSKTVRYDQEADLNLSLSLSDMDESWSITAYGRNLLEARPSYFAEDDAVGNGLLYEPLSSSNFASYGVLVGIQF